MGTGIKTSMFVVTALVIGFGLGYWVANVGSVPVADVDTAQGMHGAMEGMTAALDGKVGDAFDQTFLTEMILHHEGAVAMAEAALQNATHEEIKRMAEAIITAQTAEITQMQSWLVRWYGATQ